MIATGQFIRPQSTYPPTPSGRATTTLNVISGPCDKQKRRKREFASGETRATLRAVPIKVYSQTLRASRTLSRHTISHAASVRTELRTRAASRHLRVCTRLAPLRQNSCRSVSISVISLSGETRLVHSRHHRSSPPPHLLASIVYRGGGERESEIVDPVTPCLYASAFVSAGAVRTLYCFVVSCYGHAHIEAVMYTSLSYGKPRGRTPHTGYTHSLRCGLQRLPLHHVAKAHEFSSFICLFCLGLRARRLSCSFSHSYVTL